jgi:hypothetical protein
MRAESILLSAFAGTLALAIACAAPALAQETPASDRAWQYEDQHGACTQLRNRLTDPPAVVAACHQHYANFPRCWNYRGEAEEWFYLRQSDPRTWGFVPQVLANLGGPRDEFLVDRDPAYRQQLWRLMRVIATLDFSKWKTKSAFAAEAYRRCLSGDPF